MIDFDSARDRMVTNQIGARGVSDERVLEVLRKVPRHLFISPESQSFAYSDCPIQIGLGQTISQPYIVGLMTELLQVRPGDKVLEIGTGSGYQAAILAELAGVVHTVERHPELAQEAEARLNGLGYDNVFIHSGDGSLGHAQDAPYDRILVTAASPSVPPALKAQLADGGRLVIPVGTRYSQVLEICERKGEYFSAARHIAVVFVPLIGKEGWEA